MTHYSIGFLILTSCCLLEALPRPTNNEETTTASIDLVTETESNLFMNKERSLMYEEDTGSEGSAREIVDKIRAINDAVKRPHKRPQINWNIQPQKGGGYVMDKAVLEKLQQIIAAGKLNSYPDGLVSQDNNMIPNYVDYRQTRDLPMAQRSMVPMPYLTSMPVLVMPVPTMNGLNNDINSQQFGQQIMRQGPQSPSSFFSQFQSPLTQFFPILIKDPLSSIISGGGWNSFIESGQSADICRRQKSSSEEIENNLIDEELKTKILQRAINKVRSRQGRAIKKRTVSHDTKVQNIDTSKKVKKIFPLKPFQTTPKPAKQTISEKDTENDEEGDLRFGEFSLFGNKKPVVTSPGFFINRLKVRRGGVAIAGPGGVATAGRGGTAIVGPGGLAYTQPGGLAVAGPAARVVALASDADLSSIVSQHQDQNGFVPRSLQTIVPGGKLVAIGPIIYYHPNQ